MDDARTNNLDDWCKPTLGNCFFTLLLPMAFMAPSSYFEFGHFF